MANAIEAFDREQTTADRLSEATLETLQVEPDSTRFLAEDDGRVFFAARSDAEGTCLVVLSEEDSAGAFSSCSPGSLIGLGLPGLEVQLIDHTTGQREGWRMLASNLYPKD